MNGELRRSRKNRQLLALCLLVAEGLAGCQSGGGTEPINEPIRELNPQADTDDSCYVQDGKRSNCRQRNMYCDEEIKQCVECLYSTHCTNPETPICSQHKCVPCSEQNPCSHGICIDSGRCVECVKDADCKNDSGASDSIWGHVDHSYGDLQAGRTMCVSNECVPCNFLTCLGSCENGVCISGKRAVSCDGFDCVYSPTEFDSIDPGTRELANRIHIFHVDVADVAGTEVAPGVQAYSVDAHVNGMYATVSTEFVIYNPNSRVMEGELEFPLPDEAVVSGYAIDIDGMMMDAQVVEKKKARMAYENEVKKGVDPGLVEQIKGNAYRTRIYPIPAHGGRRVRVDYTTPLMIAPNGDAALALPMPDTKLTSRDIKISVVAQGIPAPAVGGLGDSRFTQAQAVWVVESHDTDITPGENVLVAMPNMPDTIVSTEKFKGDRYFVASVKSVEASSTIPMPRNFRIIWDASGSRTPSDIAAARKLIDALPQNATYELHVFRNKLEPAKTLNGRDKLLAALDELAYDGGTDFAPLEKIAAKKYDGITLFFTDGMDTMAGALPQFGAKSVALVSGAARDIPAMRRICGGRAINLDISNGEEAVRQILKVPAAVAELKGSGFDNVEGIGMPSAGRVTVVGRVKPGVSSATVAMSNGKNYSIKLPANDTEGKTLATAWAARRVADLSPQAEQNRDELLALGRRFSIVSPVSSMIVLENLNQWLEYDIEPPDNSPLHAAWLQNRKSDAERAREKEEKDTEWIEELTDLWDMRVAWYQSPKVKAKPPKSKNCFRRWDDDFPDEDGCSDDDVALMNPFVKSPSNALREYCGDPRGFYGCDDCVLASPALGSAASGFAPSVPAPEPARSVSAERPPRRAMMYVDDSEPAPSGIVLPSRSPSQPMEQRAPVVQGSRANIEELNAPDQFVHSIDDARESASRANRASSGSHSAYGALDSFAEDATRDIDDNVDGGVEIRDWDPSTPYLTAIRDAYKIYKTVDALYKEYLNQRNNYGTSPAFYLDCAHLFFNENQKELAVRVLSNLSELKVDNVSLLRVYAWRLRESGDLDDAVIILRKVADLRPDESISWRDLAITLTMRAKKNKNAKDAQEALNLFHKVIFTSWFNESYRDEADLLNIAVIALEDYNELISWCKRQGWVGSKVTIPKTDDKFLKNFESDLRIVVLWDSDNTDIDLMITEPNGQEIYYGNKCSITGGILSYDIVDGYGPEEYIHKYAPKGKYSVHTKYFASHEQTLIGAATITVTFYSNWGRSNQKSETVTYRLNEEKEKIKVGEFNLK